MFKIDETAMTAQVAWQYPLNKYSFWGGNVMELFNGNIEICASEPVPIGTTPPASDVPSQVLELANGPSGPEIVWQMKVAEGGAVPLVPHPEPVSGGDLALGAKLLHCKRFSQPQL